MKGPFDIDGKKVHIAVSVDLTAWAQRQIQPSCLVWLDASGKEPRVLRAGSVSDPPSDFSSAAFMLPDVGVPAVTAVARGDGGVTAYVYAGSTASRVDQTRIDLVGPSARLRIAGRGQACEQKVTLTEGLCHGVPVLDATACLDDELVRTRYVWDAPARRFADALTSPPCASLTQPVVLVSAPVPRARATERLRVTGTYARGFVVELDGKPLVTLPAASALSVSPLRVSRELVTVQVTRMLAGGTTEEDLDVYGARTGERIASVTLARGARVPGCDPEAFLAADLEVVTCDAGSRRVQHVPVAASQTPSSRALVDISARDLRCFSDVVPRSVLPPSWPRRLCLGVVDDKATPGAWFIDAGGRVSGMPELRGVHVLDGPLWRGERVRLLVNGSAGRTEWRDVPVPPEGEPRAVRFLEPVRALGGMAVTRSRLASGAIVQMQHSCSEGGGGRGGVIVFPRRGERGPDVRDVPTGQIVETKDMLVIAAAELVGNDQSGDDEQTLLAGLPKSARLVVDRGTGAWEALHLVAFDLRTRALRDAGYDAYAPATAGDGRFVLFRRYTGPPALAPSMAPERLERWDLRSDARQVLGTLVGGEALRTSKTEVFARVRDDRGERWLAVHGTTGAVRDVNAPPAEGADDDGAVGAQRCGLGAAQRGAGRATRTCTGTSGRLIIESGVDELAAALRTGFDACVCRGLSMSLRRAARRESHGPRNRTPRRCGR